MNAVFAMVDGLLSANNGSARLYVPGGPGRSGNLAGVDGAVAVSADGQSEAGWGAWLEEHRFGADAGPDQ